MTRRTRINLIAVAVATGALLVYAFTQLLATAFLDSSYPLFLELPQAAGLRTDKEVTYNGNAIGQVNEVTLEGRVVRVDMAINDGIRIPRDVDVVVLRRSAIGEQVVEIRPRGPLTEGTEFYEAEQTIQPVNVTMPPEVEDFFAAANDVLEPVDKDKAGQLVADLADTFRGRREDLRLMLRSSGSFSEQIADNGESYDRLFASARIVNAELRASRDDITTLIDRSADASQLVGDVRADYEGLLRDAPPTLALAGNLIERSQANLSCDIRYLANLNEVVAEPQNLFATSEGLRNNRFFFDGFDSFTNTDPQGDSWQRVSLLFHPETNAQSYLPEKRPIPDILPGGACESPFGSGAGAAAEAGYSRRVPEARLIPADNSRTANVRRGIGATVPPTALDLAISSAPAAQLSSTTSSRSLPATGSSTMALLLGVGLVFAGTRLAGGRRTTRTLPTRERDHGAAD